MKATAVAPSNIAFIKYWGKKNDALRLPENGSLSMNLSGLMTTTTVEFSPMHKEDVIEINGIQEAIDGSRAITHLDRIRKVARMDDYAKVVTVNNFPSGTGLSSSASGFAALTVAAVAAAGLELDEKELSILARQGSGSACRSIPDGFVEWIDGNTSDTSYGVSLYPPDWWDIVDVVVVVNEGKKSVPTTQGMARVASSPFFPVRLAGMKKKLIQAKKLLAEKRFSLLGELIEAEALEMHAVMLTSRPPLIYWTPGTLQVIRLIKKWRDEGIEVYFTINTGQDVHLICHSNTVDALKAKLTDIDEIRDVIVNKPSRGAHLIKDHLF
ncbi:MAG: diphosphomevalonate decarboxylase [Patescibacteria group bacterium]